MRPTSPPLLPLLLDQVPHTVATMLEQEGVPTAPFQPGRSNGTFVLFDSAMRRPHPKLGLQHEAIDLNDVRQTLARQGFVGDPFASVMEAGAHRAAWSMGDLRPTEEIAAIDRRAVREQAIGVLRSLIVKRGGVWMRIARYPRPYRTVANFRFDHDRYIAEDFDRTLAAIAGHEAMTTHFVCGATHHAEKQAMRRLVGLDVGSHGYRHHTYRTLPENLANLERGIAALRDCGLEPSGFAAPHGRYNAGLAAAMRALGISYSSEFGLAYDDLPFMPPNACTLQMPIHPVCLGIALEALGEEQAGGEAAKRRAVEATIEHFIATAGALRTARMPIFYYGHPDERVGRYPEVLKRVFDAIDGMPDVWQTSMTEFQRWWRARAKIELEVVGDGRDWIINAERVPADLAPALEICDGEKFATVALDRARLRVERGSLEFTTDEPYGVQSPTRLPSAFDLKEVIRRALDWERVTPIDEIASGGFTGLMKKTLRRIRG